MGRISVKVVLLSDGSIIDSENKLTRKETNKFKRRYRDIYKNTVIKFIEDEDDESWDDVPKVEELGFFEKLQVIDDVLK